MGGNVLEMVSSFYQDYSNPDQRHELDKSLLRIIRGGSFDEELETNQTFWRVGRYDLMIHNDVGFWCSISREEVNRKGVFNGFFSLDEKVP
ncbi:hypothetical protein ACKGJO_13565 [Gracilimonas sp. Q87]|uniref:hypothetical protein n=1 Tax=Gracilimonas sp. Q87 TaxID=3384766 RepID=UPI00398453E8